MKIRRILLITLGVILAFFLLYEVSAEYVYDPHISVFGGCEYKNITNRNFEKLYELKSFKDLNEILQKISANPNYSANISSYSVTVSTKQTVGNLNEAIFNFWFIKNSGGISVQYYLTNPWQYTCSTPRNVLRKDTVTTIKGMGFSSAQTNELIDLVKVINEHKAWRMF